MHARSQRFLSCYAMFFHSTTISNVDRGKLKVGVGEHMDKHDELMTACRDARLLELAKPSLDNAVLNHFKKATQKGHGQ